jgi:hypothetical protein
MARIIAHELVNCRVLSATIQALSLRLCAFAGDKFEAKGTGERKHFPQRRKGAKKEAI